MPSGVVAQPSSAVVNIQAELAATQHLGGKTLGQIAETLTAACHKTAANAIAGDSPVVTSAPVLPGVSASDAACSPAPAPPVEEDPDLAVQLNALLAAVASEDMHKANLTASSVSEQAKPLASHIVAQPSSATFTVQDDPGVTPNMSCETSGSTAFENDPDLAAAIVSVVDAATVGQTAQHDALTEIRQGALSSTHLAMPPDIIKPPQYVCGHAKSPQEDCPQCHAVYKFYEAQAGRLAAAVAADDARAAPNACLQPPSAAVGSLAVFVC